jgi:hypothetical protein
MGEPNELVWSCGAFRRSTESFLYPAVPSSAAAKANAENMKLGGRTVAKKKKAAKKSGKKPAKKKKAKRK